MKKLGILAIFLAAFGGFCFWFFSPKQKLKRKTERILNTFTVDPKEGTGGGTAAAMSIDRHIADPLKVEFIGEGALPLLPFLQKQVSIPIEHIQSGVKFLPKYFSELGHQHDGFSYKSLGEGKHEISFKHTLKARAGKIQDIDQTMQTTFLYEKRDGRLKLTKVTFK